MNGPRHAESGPVSRGRDPARWSPDRRDRECFLEEPEGAAARLGDRLRPPGRHVRRADRRRMLEGVLEITSPSAANALT